MEPLHSAARWSHQCNFRSTVTTCLWSRPIKRSSPKSSRKPIAFIMRMQGIWRTKRRTYPSVSSAKCTTNSCRYELQLVIEPATYPRFRRRLQPLGSEYRREVARSQTSRAGSCAAQAAATSSASVDAGSTNELEESHPASSTQPDCAYPTSRTIGKSTFEAAEPPIKRTRGQPQPQPGEDDVVGAVFIPSCGDGSKHSR